MKRTRNLFTFRKRAFLNSASTDQTSYVHAIVESTGEGDYRHGTNMLTIADCRRVIRLEFFLARARDRRLSLKKINLLIDVLTQFRDALANEITLIEKGNSRVGVRSEQLQKNE